MLTNLVTTLFTFLFIMAFSFNSLSQNRMLVQFVFKIDSQNIQLTQVESTLNNLPGIEMARVDLSNRNFSGIINSDFDYSKNYFETILNPFEIEIACFEVNIYENQLIKPIDYQDCTRDIKLGTARNGPCCSGHLSFGCLNGPCQAAVCAIDNFCCTTNWDAICANYAITNALASGVCAGVTDCPGAAGGGGTCCTANTGLGCQNLACQTAICNLDAFCCTNSWDAICAASAVTNALSGGACAGVSDCPSIVVAPCCTANGGLGCENAACQTAVCNIDPFCCTIIWDAFCATEAIDNANLGGACSGISDCPSGSGGPVTASDCQDAVNVCSNINFSINPNGFGLVNEIPALGSYANPDYGLSAFNPWGTTNWGCLRAGELNSTWMVVNIELGGILEFTFGGLGTQSGFYDWAMWPYDDLTCNAVINNTIAPIRCNWNGVSSGGTGIATTLPAGGNTTNYEPPLSVLTGDQYLICFSNWSSVTTNVPLEFYGTAQVSCDPILVLPVELSSFTAQKNQNDVELNWTTHTETNNNYFILERSYDGVQWADIHHIEGSGNSSQIQNYNSKDINPGKGNIYYRLSQSDFNGKVEQLSVAVVNMNSTTFNVYPNPSPNNWKLFSNDFTSYSRFAVYNLAGDEIAFESKIRSGYIEIELNNYAPGIYFLSVFSDKNELLFSTKLLGR